jgi:hypothetical protein
MPCLNQNLIIYYMIKNMDKQILQISNILVRDQVKLPLNNCYTTLFMQHPNLIFIKYNDYQLKMSDCK